MLYMLDWIKIMPIYEKERPTKHPTQPSFDLGHLLGSKIVCKFYT